MRGHLLLACAIVLACADAGAPGGPEVSTFPGFGEEFTLRIGESIEIPDAGIDVLFQEVAADSRCPSNALILCVWIGDAAVVIESTRGEADAVLDTLHTTLDPKAVDLGTITLTLIRVDPYPEDVGEIPAEEYRAVLVAERSP